MLSDGIKRHKEERRDAFGWRMLDTLRRDGTHHSALGKGLAVRRAIAVLALGIGANAAVFSILNNTLFLPHPFTKGRRLVNLAKMTPRPQAGGRLPTPASDSSV